VVFLASPKVLLKRILSVKNQQILNFAVPCAFHGVGPSNVNVSLMLAMLEEPTRSASIAVTSAMK
jgi:hypothetical protein